LRHCWFDSSRPCRYPSTFSTWWFYAGIVWFQGRR
jgi:hypothetical protein